MRSVSTRGTRTAAGDLVASSYRDSFYKDDRKISVGDCALFKPPQDSPPFIGIIRSLTLSKESNLQLTVNWLYRPTEVKLGKGIPPDASPNEIFYSFHKDETPAASLLHPCKVAFLPKGVDLPPGISSYVCWQVYDVASKHFWWLTDQDYINVRQEEVDQLLYKTRIEMHATGQSGGRSPKPVNGPTSQLKPGSDNIYSSTSFPSHVKGKKRERGDQGLEHAKRERSLKIDDGAPSQLKAECVLKSEIAKMTEKGGLVESEGVEKLLQLMQPDRFDKKLDLTCQSMLASVIAATDKFDCLNRFVQLRGLPVLDEWLQHVHKGKIGDSGSPKDGDKNVEEFLWVLLRALDKLPVNLHALQMCNIGRSVNHLRTHKNLEIQKKARGLVDMWKKRVETEMNIIDGKSGSNQAVSWPSKSLLPEVSHGGSRQYGGSSEVAAKSSVTQLSASETVLTKPLEGEGTGKSASSSPGPVKSVLLPTTVKDNQPRISVGNSSDLPSTTVREEKSSSSSQSHNYSHSFSGKEDTRSSSAGSMSVNKMLGGASRQRKSITGLGGKIVSGGQRETRSSRNSSLNRNSASEKVLQSVLTCEKAIDVPVVEGNGHKLIVKIPNRGGSPAQSASGGSFEDPSIMNSIASSPVISENQDQFDCSLKEKSDECQANTTSDVNTESWQSNDFKDVLTGSDQGDGSPAAIADEERSRIADDSKKLPEVVKTASSSSGNELKSEKLNETSFSSMNALIESCVKYSKRNASMSHGDDIGMNLLATVAAGEMSKSDLVSPTDSPQRNIPIGEDTCMGDDESKALPGDNFPRDVSWVNDGADVTCEKKGVTACSSFSKDGLHLSKLESTNISDDRKTAPVSSEETPMVERIRHCSSSIVDLQLTAISCVDTCEKSDEFKNPVPMAGLHSNRTEKATYGELIKLNEEMKNVKDKNVDRISDTRPKQGSTLSMAEKANDSLLTVEGEKQVGDVTSNSLPEIDGNNKVDPSEQFVGIHAEQIPHSGKVKPELVETATRELLQCAGSSQDFVPESSCKFKVGKANEKDTVKPGDPLLGYSSGGVGENKGVFEEHNCGEDVPHKESSAFSSQKSDRHVGLKESKISSIDVDKKKKFASVMVEVSSSSTAGVPDSDSKLKFDLNEGFITDDGKFGEPMNLLASGYSSAVHLINPVPFSAYSVSCNFPSSITVAAAAKGPFVTPDDLLNCKGELGWKGSASTSAFRPAEPLKIAETPQASTSTPVSDASSSRQGRLPLDIDLNVPDERVLKDMSGREGDQGIAYMFDLVHNNLAQNELVTAPTQNPGGLDLDSNQVDEANDMGQHSASTSCRLDIPVLQVKSTSLGRISNGEIRRDFDLNDGPSFDDMIAEPSFSSQQNRNSLQSQPHATGLIMNNPEIGKFSSWFTPANAYSAVAIPSVLSDRGEPPFPMAASGAPQRMLCPATGVGPFTPDVYRGSVVSLSSPAMSFPSTPFQYPGFPFGTSLPLPSATLGSTAYMESSSGGRLCFPAVQSQLLGPAGAVSTHYPRPCVINVSEGGSSGGVESNRKWGRQFVDLNAIPGVIDLEVRDDTAPLASRQLSVASSQALAEEQTRIYEVASGALKRKEPERGWERAFGTNNPHGSRNL